MTSLVFYPKMFQEIANCNVMVTYLINIWVPHFCQKSEGWWRIWVIYWEFQMSLKIASFVERVGGTEDRYFPIVEIGLVHQSDPETFHRLLLQTLKLQH